MKLTFKTLLVLVFVCTSFGCKKEAAVIGPGSSDPSPLTGVWKCSLPFLDTLDPEHTFSPTFDLRSDYTFEETARFVDYRANITRGYKYVKTGTYKIATDTLIITTTQQAYLSFADSLQPKPTPTPVTPYNKTYRFTQRADSLGVTEPSLPDPEYIFWYRKEK